MAGIVARTLAGMGSPTLVVLGASGDLAARLLFPALLSLEQRERLEDLRIIGYARQEWTNEQFHENLRAAMTRHVGDVDEKYFDKFIDRIDFHGGDISVESLRVAARRARRARDLLPRAPARRVRRRGRDDRRRPVSPTRRTAGAGS